MTTSSRVSPSPAGRGSTGRGRRGGAGQGDQPGLGGRVELGWGRGRRPGLAVEGRLLPLLDEPLADPDHGPAVQADDLGDVGVGPAAGGLVIGTISTRLIDGSQFRLPRTGVFTVKGVNMGKQGVVPDAPVEITFADWAAGTDTRLARAVEVVAGDVVAWKKSRLPPGSATRGREPSASQPAPAVAPMPAPKARPATPDAPAPAARPALFIPKAAE